MASNINPGITVVSTGWNSNTYTTLVNRTQGSYNYDPGYITLPASYFALLGVTNETVIPTFTCGFVNTTSFQRVRVIIGNNQVFEIHPASLPTYGSPPGKSTLCHMCKNQLDCLSGIKGSPKLRPEDIIWNGQTYSGGIQ